MIRALVILIVNLISLCRRAMRAVTRMLTGRFRKRKRRFVKLPIPKGLSLTGEPRKIGPITIGQPGKGPYWHFDALIEKIARDPDIEGVFFKLESGQGGLAEIGVIADRLARLRDANKRVICHLDQAMLKDYLLATSADTIMMTPPGRLYTFGMRMEMMFLAEAFEKIGIEAQFVHLGPFKTAMHRFTRRRMSRAQHRGSRQLIEGLAHTTLARVVERRKISPEDAAQLFDKAPIPAREARRLKLIDQTIYAGDIKEALEAEEDCERPVSLLSADEYARFTGKELKWRPLFKRADQIAVLSLEGMIMMGNEGLPMQFRKLITPKPIIKALKAIAKDPKIKAVVLHIDSPGGSALASDLIWRQVRKLAEKKPVIASLGNVAASGGYYIAVGASTIVAQAESLTGSIGVIAGKLSGGGLLSKLGVHTAAISVGETAGFTSLTTAMNDREVENLQRDIRSFYRRFLHRVAVGRSMHKRTLHRLARGRVYTGKRAHAIGLVDHIGDLDHAIDLACSEVGLDRQRATINFIDHRQTGFKSLFRRGVGGAAAQTDFETSAAIPGAQPQTSLGAMIGQELLPESWQPYVATAMLMRSGNALALWPYLPDPT